MRRRQRLPISWLFTDRRLRGDLVTAIARLPRGSGIVFRHYGEPSRVALACQVAAAARRHGHLLVVAGDARLAKRLGAGLHLRSHGPALPALTAAAHDRAGIVRARRAGAAIVFLSPVFATASHLDVRPIGPVLFGLAVKRAGIAVGALGGMTGERFQTLARLGAAAWGAIDAWDLP